MVIAKMLGFFQIHIKNPATGMEIKWNVLIMENLFYDRNPSRVRLATLLPHLNWLLIFSIPDI